MAHKYDHHWLGVGDRRWCLTCDAYQWRVCVSADWRPSVAPLCAYDSEYARKRLG